MDHTSVAPMLGGFAILGAVLGCVVRGWSSIKEFFKNCAGILFVHAHLDDEATAQATLAYLIKHYQRGFTPERTYGGRHDTFRDGRYGHIPYELLGAKSIRFWAKRWIPFWFTVQAPTQDTKAQVFYWGSKPKDQLKCSIVFLRGTLNVEEIVQHASQARNQLYWASNARKNTRFFVKKIPDPKESGLQRFSAGTNLQWFNEGVYRLLSHDPSELGRATVVRDGGRVTDRLYFPPHVQGLIDEIRSWHDLKDWYLERGIPWKRGWCLYGPPGTGKTALVRAIAEDMDMPLFVYSLGYMLDEDLEKSWDDMQVHTPCVALFEDFDTVFNGRNNVYGKATLAEQIMSVKPADSKEKKDESTVNAGKLSFGCLLNCLDGADKANGIFTVITTNHVDHLDPALGVPRRGEDGKMELISTRPGRIDKAVELGYMEKQDKLRLARRIFYDNEEGFRTLERDVLAEDKKETPAQFQERCAQLALRMLWEQREARAKSEILSQAG